MGMQVDDEEEGKRGGDRVDLQAKEKTHVDDIRDDEDADGDGFKGCEGAKGVFEDLMRDPHLRQLVGQTEVGAEPAQSSSGSERGRDASLLATPSSQRQKAMKPSMKAMKKTRSSPMAGDRAIGGRQRHGVSLPAAADAAGGPMRPSVSSPSIPTHMAMGTGDYLWSVFGSGDGSTPGSGDPVSAARVAMDTVRSYLGGLQRRASLCEREGGDAMVRLQDLSMQAKAAGDEVADLERRLDAARARERALLDEAALAEREAARLGEERRRAEDAMVAARMASRHIEEGYQCLHVDTSPGLDPFDTDAHAQAFAFAYSHSPPVAHHHVSVSLEEEVRREEEEARRMAVERSRREKEEILRERQRARKQKESQQGTRCLHKVVLSSSDLFREGEEGDNDSATSATMTQKEGKLVDTSPDGCGEGESCEEEEEGDVRDCVKHELREHLTPFMPTEHQLRAASDGSVPERSRACPGQLCNHHCATECLKQCAAGFLLAVDVSVSPGSGGGDGGEVGWNDLMNAVKDGMKKFHPDRNSKRRVGVKRSVYCEEVSKCLSLLQSLMETVNEVTLVVVSESGPEMKMKVSMSLSETIASLKKRVAEDFDKVDASAFKLTLSGADLVDEQMLGSCGIKENCIVKMLPVLKGWTKF